jgi:uncharacterized protein (TIGR02466 family)
MDPLKILKIHELALFPTYIYTYYFEQTYFFDTVKKYLIECKQNNIHGSIRYDEIDSYTTVDNLHEVKEFEYVTNIIKDCFKLTLDKLDIDYSDIDIQSMWANVNGNKIGGFHDLHLHANSYLSCVLYISTPEGSGNIVFEDPRDSKNMIVWDSKHSNNNMEKYGSWELEPKQGILVVFPSYLRHKVKRGSYKDGEERIAISANCFPISQCTQTSLRYKYKK